MKLYQIYFSPTGGCRNVVRFLSKGWICEKEEIDLLLRDDIEAVPPFTGKDICIVAAPSFGGRVPKIAVEKLKKLRGNGARAVLTAVYGNREFEDTLVELQDVLTSAGFSCVAAVAAVAEHSIVHKFAAGRPDEADQKELEDFAHKIREQLESGRDIGELKIPGNRPYKEYHGSPMHPRADESCVRCGRCAAECPAQAIPPEAPMQVEETKCISCMHCIAICPKGARKMEEELVRAVEQKIGKSCSERKANKLYL